MSAAVNTSAPGEGERATTEQARAKFWALALGSIGVVYGDIGTSPLYAMREALVHTQDGGISRQELLGVTSLLLWALLFIVTAKYVLFLMRADNRGEGGTLSLMALAQSAMGRPTAAGVRAGRGRGGIVLWRCADHAGDLGPVRGRGPEARDAGVRPFRGPDHRRHPACSCSRLSVTAPAGWRPCSARSRSSGSWPSVRSAFTTSATT